MRSNLKAEKTSLSRSMRRTSSVIRAQIQKQRARVAEKERGTLNGKEEEANRRAEEAVAQLETAAARLTEPRKEQRGYKDTSVYTEEGYACPSTSGASRPKRTIRFSVAGWRT